MTDARAAVLDAFVRVMGESPARGDDTEPRDTESWTSLTHVHLIAEIEASLGIELPQEMLITMGPLGAIIQAVSEGDR